MEPDLELINAASKVFTETAALETVRHSSHFSKELHFWRTNGFIFFPFIYVLIHFLQGEGF